MTRPLATSRLFPDSHAAPPAGVHLANIDGASRGNPGPASYAVILRDPAGKVIFQLCKKLGRQTNNVAEYYALLAALDYAANHGIRALRVRSDSELLVRQIQGRYKVKSPELRPLHERAMKLTRQLEYFVIEHVLREMNRDADALANLALDGRELSSSQGAAAQSAPKTGSEPTSGPPSDSSDSDKPLHSATPASRRIRARIVNGALVPAKPLDLPEGSEVVVIIRKSQ